MIDRPNPHDMRPDYIPTEAMRLAMFRQSEETRDGKVAPFTEPETEH